MKSRGKNLYFLFQFTIPWVFLTLAFTSIAHLTESGAAREKGFVWITQTLIIANLAGACLFGILFLPIFLLFRNLNYESNQNYFRNFFIHLLHGALFLFFQLAVYTVASGWLAPDFFARYPQLLPYFKGMSMGGLSISVTFYAVIVFALQTYLSRLRHAEEEKKTAQLRSELVQAQLQALKMQIQPHFLFNTLNSISSLVLTNPPQAYEMIARLGDFLRLTLDYGEDQSVPLAEELRFLRSYLEIEQVRFSDKLEIKYDVEPETLNAMVPHLMLQPIVENSIKHAVSRRRSESVIEISAGKFEDKLRLQIKDNGTGEKIEKSDAENTEIIADKENGGTGLANVKNRLRYFYGSDAGFEVSGNDGGGTTVTIELPLNFDSAAARQN